MEFIRVDTTPSFEVFGYYVAVPEWAAALGGRMDAVQVTVLLAIALFLVLHLRRAILARHRTPAPPDLSPAARAGTGCKWRKARGRTTVSSTCWTCSRCGVDAYSQDRCPPKECKRALRPASL